MSININIFWFQPGQLYHNALEKSFFPNTLEEWNSLTNKPIKEQGTTLHVSKQILI